MGVFGCFGGTPEKEKIQSIHNISPAKVEKVHRIKRGSGKTPPVILEHAEAIAPNYDEEYCIGTGDDFSDITVPARPGGSSLSSCGSTNIPLKHAAAGVLAWAHVDELAEEVAELRRRLRAEEEHARRLAEEVVTLRSNGQDSGIDASQSGSPQSGGSNWSDVRPTNPQRQFSRQNGPHSNEPKESSSIITTTNDDNNDDDNGDNDNDGDEDDDDGDGHGDDDDDDSDGDGDDNDGDESHHSDEGIEFENLDAQLPTSSASMGPVDDVADEEHHADLPMLHTDEQWEKLIRQGVRSRTWIGKKSFSPLRRQRRRAVRQPGSAPPGPIRASRDLIPMNSGEDEHVLTRRSLFRNESQPWDTTNSSADDGGLEYGKQILPQGAIGVRKVAVNKPTQKGDGDGDEKEDGDGDGDGAGDELSRQSPTLCLGLGTGMGVKGEGGESSDSKASEDIQNVRGSAESDSSFALAPPPGSPMESLDSANMDPRGRVTHERDSVIEVEEYGDLTSISTPRYIEKEQPSPFVEEKSVSLPASRPIEGDRNELDDDWSYLPKTGVALSGELDIAAATHPFSESLYRNISSPQHSDSNGSPELKGDISYENHASPSSVEEETDIHSAHSESSSFESCREDNLHLPPRSELPFFPLTQDMLQLDLDKAEMTFTNPVFAEDV